MGHAQTLRRRKGRMPGAPARRLGTWKLAYADFLTALVAFFLVMWLVKGLPEEGRQDLADYFTAETSTATASDPTAHLALSPADHLAGLIRSSRKLSDYSETVSVMAQAETVRIDVMDREAKPVFAMAGTEITETGVDVISTLGEVVSLGDWPVSIEGHTDAFPSIVAGADNWDLSTARAHAARRALTASGLTDQRIVSVTGLADTMPINPGEPHLAANRRVTLILHVASEPSIS